MSPNKAPSHGQKVTLGENAPVTREGPGAVHASSLAAESQAFQAGNEAAASQSSRENVASASKPHEGRSYAQAGTGTEAKHVPQAPSYVHSQYDRAHSRPHGKNITEDNSIGDDEAKNASFTEFGTAADPSHLAEERIIAVDSTPANLTGTRQKHIDGKTIYDSLGSDQQA
ncbi:hypothetical protein JX266_010680 [Neoarthrinium moseri]|uniref:uncharacterized protein n=1 Tax=Neoarthrinium moseri TaxID=1658444 RepID=UPI001FDB7EB1|nr:uncharacterized protein JN550_008532 [Neoarthrinium moseri]KAI1843153.1 hypothetical protein JX266_010680 [Neoarthrinium moseri]KAI1864986.1 hypothetical protein JN550_008532 [Neoarthrinium moseri]